MPRNTRVETWRLSQLKPHPCWSALYGDLAAARSDVFDEDVIERGVQVRPEILPDGTVIDGWIRKGSYGRIGQREIEVLVRYDLVDLSPEALEDRMLANELNRRHRTPLSLAKLIHRRCELEVLVCMPAGARCITALHATAIRAAAKDKIAAYLGITLRSVNLYLKAIMAPKVVRDACDRKEITLTKTGQVGELSDATKTTISRLIRGGTTAAAAVGQYLPTPNNTTGAARLRRFAQSCDHHVPLVRGHVSGLTRAQVDAHRRELSAARRLIDRLLAI